MNDLSRVHAPADVRASRERPRSACAFVRDGFSWWRVFFGPLWLLAHGLWLALRRSGASARVLVWLAPLPRRISGGARWFWLLCRDARFTSASRAATSSPPPLERPRLRSRRCRRSAADRSTPSAIFFTRWLARGEPPPRPLPPRPPVTPPRARPTSSACSRTREA